MLAQAVWYTCLDEVRTVLGLINKSNVAIIQL